MFLLVHFAMYIDFIIFYNNNKRHHFFYLDIKWHILIVLHLYVKKLSNIILGIQKMQIQR